jgi:GNAT superfamily N-acetyltransferase
MNKLPHVRLVCVDDIPELLELSTLIHEENGFMPYSPQRVEALIARAVAQDRLIMGVIGPVGGIEGITCVTIGQFYYTDDLHLEEVFTYVRPEYRKSDNMKALIEFDKEAANRIGVPFLTGVISTNRTAAKIRLYERRLGKQSGAYFLIPKKVAQ